MGTRSPTGASAQGGGPAKPPWADYPWHAMLQSLATVLGIA